MKTKIIFAVFALSAACLAQAGRFDTTLNGSTYINGVKTVAVLGGATMNVCTAPANATPCTNYATIYTDSTATVSATNPVTADANGNSGFWALPGQYQYTYTYQGQSFGPYSVTIATNPGALPFVTVTPGSDIGAAINTALANFGTAPACGDIYVPQGTYTFSTTIVYSNRKGCHFHGAGMGIEGNPGTILKWTGPSGGRMFDVQGNVRGSWFEEFQLDGNALASNCLDIRGTAAQSTTQNKFTHIYVWNCTGPSAIGIHIGDTTTPDVSANEFDSDHVSYNAGTMTAEVQQDGGQTVTNPIHNSTFTYTGAATPPTYHANFVLGDINFDHNQLLGPAGTAKIEIGAGTLWGNIEDNYDETAVATADCAPAVQLASGNHPWRFTFSRNRWEWNCTDTANKVIDSLTNASVVFKENTIDTSGGGNGKISFNNTSTGVQQVTWENNVLNGTNNFDLSIGSNLSIIAKGANATALCYGGAAPCPQSSIFSDQSRYASLMIYDNDPRIFMRNKSAAADAGTYDFVTTATSIGLRAINDARNTSGYAWQCNGRTGNTFTNCTFIPPLIAPNFISSTPNVASVGTIRLAKSDTVYFRNNANGGDILALSLDANDHVLVNGAIPTRYVGTITTTAAASDNLSVTGLTATGHCSYAATNATAAGLTGVYGAAGSGAYTLNHSASANGTFDIFCAVQ